MLRWRPAPRATTSVARGGIEPPTYRLSGGSLHLSGVLRPEIPGLAGLAHEAGQRQLPCRWRWLRRRTRWLDAEGTTWRFEPVAASGSWAATCRPARPGSVWAATPSAAREQSAPPPTERTSARRGIGAQRRPGPAILAGPLRRRTGTAAKTAAAQVGKRCQLSNGTRHG